MKRRRYLTLGLIAVLLLTVLSLVVAGCGRSANTTADESTDTTTASTGQSDGIVVSGLVDTPMTFTSMDTDYMYWTTVTADHPTLGSKEFEGVPLSDIFAYVGVQDDATTVVVTGADSTSAEMSLTDLTGKDALITVADDGTMSAIMPGMDSKYWVENIVGMEFK